MKFYQSHTARRKNLNYESQLREKKFFLLHCQPKDILERSKGNFYLLNICKIKFVVYHYITTTLEVPRVSFTFCVTQMNITSTHSPSRGAACRRHPRKTTQNLVLVARCAIAVTYLCACPVLFITLMRSC